ncbi:OPT superfamily oligopeptide transporter [Sodiomyces alkalinus F11]|uniref:OPT superfamily oligopeptide transporter n=1 Tax=Sodiomyces alkalinus (strain CBS 110278 / VKM F-3762 / F11) TaxID=1314773 RepID=A0A3N2Q9A8_SODAK|nr:OPT superfamily oligopeptide transporter [Sodiomyces alkalinus F11]ROT43353.1 OPT superfamily oligopeptide transporter [Sodiomyces alkalinus F11]
MAPDRGDSPNCELLPSEQDANATSYPRIEGESFTIRGVAVGLLVGLVICFSNMYFGLQTGWVSTMTLPASLVGFGVFQALSRHLSFPFSPVENVLVQSVAGSMAIMPLGCGFVGVLPAMNYILAKEEQGPISLSLWQLIVWALGLCYFGVVFAVPLRRQVIIREKLRFPSGYSTAVLVSVLHGQTRAPGSDGTTAASSGDFASLVPVPVSTSPDVTASREDRSSGEDDPERYGEAPEEARLRDWAKNVRLLLICFLFSAFYTLCTYFLPRLRSLPILGRAAAHTWLWTLNPSPAYIGQGIIMGPETTLHMLLGAIIGWGVLSPLAKHRGWAPGPIGDWESGSKGWIVWVSLAIMLADAFMNLGHLILRSLWPRIQLSIRTNSKANPPPGYSAIRTDDDHSTGNAYRDEGRSSALGRDSPRESLDADSPLLRGQPPPGKVDIAPVDDAPAEQQVGNTTVGTGLIASILLCIMTVRFVFGELVPLYATVIAVMLALLLSIMGVRALGETDLNPVSGISKLAQVFFALIIPQSHQSGVIVNLVAGAISEAGALQAGELMQDLKTGHLLGAAPAAQFWGQIIGATVGAVVSAFVYKLYTAVYPIPGDLFQIPTAYVWIFTARLVTGKGLPIMAKEWSLGFGILFAFTTIIRATRPGVRWRPLVPGGIAVAIGMYNVPSFTLARTMGGLLAWYWSSWRGPARTNTPLIILASGFILGEGFFSVVNLILQSASVPHFT